MASERSLGRLCAPRGVDRHPSKPEHLSPATWVSRLRAVRCDEAGDNVDVFEGVEFESEGATLRGRFYPARMRGPRRRSW